MAPEICMVSCRLLYLIGRLHTGGSERQLWYLVQAMDRERYKPAVAVWTHGQDDVYISHFRALGVPLYTFSRNLSSIAKIIMFRRLVKTLQPEVVHSYSFYTNFAPYFAAWGTKIIPIGSIRSDFTYAKTECGPVVGRLSGRWPSNQVTNSFTAAESVRVSHGIFIPRQLSVVRNGLDWTGFRSYPVPDTEPVCIAGIGYLLPVKRWERLLEALKELRKRNLNCMLRIAGDGPLRSALERKAEDLGVGDWVQFMGHVDDVSQLLAKAAVVVHTADSEGSPNSVIEAMACGRPVVATDAGDVPFLVDDGKTGFVVRRDDHAALVDRIAQLIVNPKLCRSMGKAAREKVERDFGLERLVKETLFVYRAAGWRDS